MGIGDSWGTREELLHPRDKNGRFRSKWKMASGVIAAILKALGSFNPRTFGSDAEAGQYLFNKAKPSRFRGGTEFPRLASDFAGTNKALRSGNMDPASKKFVQIMDESGIDLPDDVIASRIVGPEAFGLTPETMNAEDGGIEDFTGKLIADRGYQSMNMGTPMRKQPGQIEMRVAVPKGTRAIIPATSRGDRELILDHDQELRVTKVKPDGQGGFFVLAVAQPRTPGETPTPLDGNQALPGETPAQREARVNSMRQSAVAREAGQQPAATPFPDKPNYVQRGQAVQSDNAPDPRAMVQAPGAPPPRVEPEVTPAIGGGPDQPRAPGAAAVPGVEPTPDVVPEAPPTPRIVDLRAAVQAAKIPSPSRGENRGAFNDAYLGLTTGKKDPVDVLRDLETDIGNLERGGRVRDRGGLASTAPDPTMLQGDIASLKGLRDLIRKEYDLPAPAAPAPAKKAAPAAPRTQAGLPKLERPPPTKKAVPEAPAKPLTAAEARIQAALDAVKAKPIAGKEGNSYRNIVNGLENGDLTPAGAAKQARDSAKYYRKSADTVGNFSRPNESGREVERRKAAVDRINALADRYDKLADDIKASQAPPAKKAAPAKAAPEAPAAPGDDLDSMLKTELVQEARKVGVTNPTSMTKPQLKDAIREGRNKPSTLTVNVPEVDAALALPQVPKSRVQNGDIAVWQGRGETPAVGRYVDLGSRKPKYIDWNGGRRDRVSAHRAGPNVTFHREGAAPAKAAPVKKVAPAKAAPEAPAMPGDNLSQVPKSRAQIQNDAIAVWQAVSVAATADREVEVEDRVRAAYRAVLADENKSPGDWIGLAALREKIGTDIPRNEVDDALRRLNIQDPGTTVAPESNQKTLRPVDRAAAVSIGNQSRHTIVIDDPSPRGAAPAPEAPAPAAPAATTPLKIGAGVSSVSIKPKDKIWIGEDEDGWGPTKRKGGSLQLTVGQVERVMYKGKRGYRFSGVDQDGNRRVTRPTHGQNTYQRVEGGSPSPAPAPDTATPAAFPDNDGAPVDTRRALRRSERNDMADVIDRLLADGANVDGFDDKLGGRGSVKDNLETMRDELRGSKKMTPGDVGIVTNSIFHRLGLGRTTSGFHDDQERADIELRNLLSSRLPEITRIPAGPNTSAGKAARTKVDGPKVDAPVLMPDRRSAFRDAVDKLELNLGTDSVGRQTSEIIDDMESGKLTPGEGIRRLETEISMNKEELTDLDRAIREEGDRELKNRGRERRKRLADSIGEQERASAALRKHFGQEPAVTTDTIVIELPQEMRDGLDKATIQDLKKAAKLTGLREPKGRTKKAVLDDIVKQMAAKELERRELLPKKVDAPKAPDKPKPTPAGAKYERIDLHALAEGLPLSMRQEERMFKHFQELLDGEKMTPSSIAKEMDATGQRAFYWPAVVNKQVGIKTIYPETDAAEADRIQAHNAEVMAETERLIAKGDAWKELTERVRKIRRKSAGSAPPPAPEPKLTAPEKAEIKQVAELVDIPAPTLAKKALAKKQADAGPSAMARQVAQTLETVSDREAVDKILKGRTKPELVEIAKAMDIPVRSNDTKAKISDQIGAVVGGRIEHGALVRGTDSRLTRADLEQMTVPEIKELEDELGIVRTSLVRSDRIDAILAKGGGAPAAPDLEEAARTRQADIDQARKIGNAAGEWDQILDAGASPQAMVARLRAAEARDGIDLSRIIQSVEEGNMQQARIQMQTLVDRAGLIKRGNAGKIQQYHAASDQLLPGQSIGPSGRVRVIRPGYSLRRDGKLITLSRPVVEPVDEPEAPSAPAAPKMSSKPIIENTWGGSTTEVHFHADGVIGSEMRRLGEDRKLEVDGDALENVLGKLATQLVMGNITGDQLVTRLRALAARLPEGRAKKTVTGMADDIDAPKRGPIKVPDAGQYTGVLQELMDKLLEIPLARGGSRANRQDFNEVDLLLDYIKDLRPTRAPSLLEADLRRALHNKRHESMEGKMAIDRAIEAAMKRMRDMKRQSS